MAIRASDLALCDLSRDRIPAAPTAKHRADVIDLVPKVVEFKDGGVGLSAIYARVFPQIVQDPLTAQLRSQVARASQSRDLAFSIRRVPSRVVGRVALTTP
jgi:hypothetical protein